MDLKNLNLKLLVIFFFVLLLSLLLGVFIGYLISFFRYSKRLAKEKKEALVRSKSILSGQFTEQISPFFPNFPYNPKDLKFLGSPVDFIVFNGLSCNNLKEIVFLEIKTGKSQLNFNEKSLREAINNKKVSYKEYRL